MRRGMIRGALVALALALVPAASAWAQLPTNGAPTRAGTKIVNRATVTYTDENNNAYDPVSDSVAVTVARIVGVEITGPAVNPTPESPSTGNVIEYTITNRGNDFDEFKLNVDPGDGITVTGFTLDPDNGPWYDDLADFNAFLETISIDYAGNNGKDGVGDGVGVPNDSTITIYVRYDIGPDFDPDEKLVVEVESKEDPSDPSGNDQEEISFDPVPFYSVTVGADDPAVSRLPSGLGNTVQYGATFTVTNNGSGDQFTWEIDVRDAENSPGTVVVVVRTEDGQQQDVGVTNGTLTLAPGTSAELTVIYTVDENAVAGTAEQITMTVTSVADGNVSDAGTTTVTVIRPALSITKQAFADKAETPLAAGTVTPGAIIWYKITVSNANTHGAEAWGVEIKDELPDALEYLSSEVAAGTTGDWSREEPSGGTNIVKFAPVDGSNNPRAMAPGETAIFWIEVRVK